MIIITIIIILTIMIIITHYAIKGQHRSMKNILSWFDNDFVLIVIETACVTFAFRSKPRCNIFLKFNIRIFCFYVLW